MFTKYILSFNLHSNPMMCTMTPFKNEDSEIQSLSDFSMVTQLIRAGVSGCGACYPLAPYSPVGQKIKINTK